MAARRIAALVLAFGFAGPAAAVTIDINRDPGSAVVPNDLSDPYGGVGVVEFGGGYCSGVPLSARVVLTAAHCIGAQPDRIRFYLPVDGGPAIERGGTARLHPGYDSGIEPFDQPSVPDIAVVKLQKPLPGTVPTYSLLGPSRSPLGQAFEFVGYGMTGTGDTGTDLATASRDVKRFARNELERPELGGQFFSADFDGGRVLAPGEDTGPDSTGLSKWNVFGTLGTGVLEGMISFGDSGEPAFYNPAIAAEVLLARQPDLVLGPLFDRPLVMGIASYLEVYRLGQPTASFGTSGTFTSTIGLIDWLLGFDPQGIAVVSGAVLCTEDCGDVTPVPVPLGGSLGFIAAAFAGLAVARRLRPVLRPA